MDYLDYVAAEPRPSVVVIEDKDEPPGYGAFWGEVQTNVHKALGCLGTVTNGSIRDIAQVAEGFQMLAGSIAPSHAYVHVEEFGVPVRIHGMDVKSGDLIHADRHGAVVVPADKVDALQAALDGLIKQEARIIAAARKPGVTRRGDQGGVSRLSAPAPRIRAMGELSLNPFDLTGRVAIVTGGNGGLGLGMARGLAQAGATIAIAARNQDKGRNAAAALTVSGFRCRFYPLQASSKASCTQMVEAVVGDFGRCDILINNAGTTRRKRPEQISEDDWREVLDVNLSGAMFCAQAAYPHMKAAGRGKIVNIGSMYSLFGAPLVAPYAASKGGLVALTRSLACAWAADNIQVNAILPGWINSDLTKSAREQIEGLNNTVLSRTPAGRWGEPDDLAGAAVFLSSAASDFITGITLPVDGGFSARG